uniref:Heavy metal translocating P-type ATPase n=1 Tax=Ignisphaera aggregans TaxID=334771 RepID=A0A7J3Z842_9CREN
MGMRVKEEIKVIGVDCPTCIYNIRRSIERKNLNIELEVDVSTGSAFIIYDSEKTSLAEIAEAIRHAGYDVEKSVVRIYTTAREADACSREEKLERLPGIIDARVSPLDGLAVIEYNPYTLTHGRILEYISRLGYRVIEEERVAAKREIVGLGVRRVLAFILATTVLVVHHAGFLEGLLGHHVTNSLIAVLSSIVLALNYDVVYTGLKPLTRLSPTMNSLIALSSTTTFVYSLAVLTHSLLNSGGSTDVLFFESSAGVLGFVSLGKYIEERIERRALSRFEELARRLEGRVRALRGNELVELDIEDVKPGDLVEARSGEKILVDGVVVEGKGYVDKSVFTGELEPRLKKASSRDPVLAGSILVNGYLVIRVTRVGEDTLLSRMLGIARTAQFTKPKFQRIADKIVGYLTWIVILLAIATFTYWYLFKGAPLDQAVLFTAAVLAVTCPCPLGIAIPLVVALSIIKSMDAGLLVRRGDLFEKVHYANMVVFDKTGTLTHGKFTVVEVVPLNYSFRDLLEYTCIAEKRSEHLLAKAIVDYCSAHGINPPDPDDFTPLPGLGVLAEYKGHAIVVGSYTLMREMNINVEGIEIQRLEATSSITSKVVYIAVDGVLRGVIVLGDKIREEASDVVKALRERGYEVGILTGDVESAAKNVAEKLGIGKVWSELRPEDKARTVEDLQKQGYRIIYVGDGVNDAIAMAKSFACIAMGGGSDILRETGDAIIVNDRLSSLIHILEFSKIARRKFIENLGWAFIYNAVLVPIAMGLLYEPFNIVLRPEHAAIAMILSDISVIANSTLILKWTPRFRTESK